MTEQQHPITPPPELVKQWCKGESYDGLNWTYERHIATQAARWGADQELEACRNWLRHEDVGGCGLTADWLYEARRPKSPSLKEQALELVDRIEKAESVWAMSELDTIRRALELLDD